ncbi:MAG: hypothetical protein HDR29_01880 [Lachnospiraceae bacterium]|nr:hypothetical protein [Lachnospiraceae bacterium]
MPVSEKQKLWAKQWDKENMRSLTCRVRAKDAEIFKQYCKAHGTTAGELLKKYVGKCIYEYGEELRKAEQESEQQKADD